MNIHRTHWRDPDPPDDLNLPCECVSDTATCEHPAVFVTRCERRLCHTCVFLYQGILVVHCGCPESRRPDHVRTWPDGAPCPIGQPPFEQTELTPEPDEWATWLKANPNPYPTTKSPTLFHAWYDPETADRIGRVYYRHSVTGETIAITEVGEHLRPVWKGTWVGVVDQWLGEDAAHTAYAQTITNPEFNWLPRR